MKKQRPKTRRAAIAVLVAILMVPFLAMVAFSVDMGYILRTKTELQNAADAAALAGAAKMVEPSFNGLMNQNTVAGTMITNARSEAQKFAGLSSAGNKTLTLPGADVVIGYMASPGNQQSTLSAWSAGTPPPNSIQVLMRRDATANTPVNLFFARVLGISSWSGTASATASYMAGSNVTGFKSAGPNGKLLPIAVDVTYWNTFLATGKSPDGTLTDAYSFNGTNTVSSGSDNIPEFNDTYPNKNSPGNFGLVDIGPPSNADPTFASWIDSGPTQADLSYFGANGLQATPSAPATMKGGPGLKSSLDSNLANAVGEPRVIPLFSSFTGQGSNTEYTIVGFAGITIVSCTGNGKNIQVIIEPAVVTDSTATTGSGSGSNFVYQTYPLSLTR